MLEEGNPINTLVPAGTPFRECSSITVLFARCSEQLKRCGFRILEMCGKARSRSCAGFASMKKLADQPLYLLQDGPQYGTATKLEPDRKTLIALLLAIYYFGHQGNFSYRGSNFYLFA